MYKEVAFNGPRDQGKRYTYKGPQFSAHRIGPLLTTSKVPVPIPIRDAGIYASIYNYQYIYETSNPARTTKGNIVYLSFAGSMPILYV